MCVLVIVLMAAGVLATLDMPTNLLPNIKLPMVGISVVYPGASAQSVENGVTDPLQRALQTVSGITELQTTSYDNVSVAILTFDYGTDIDEKISDIEDAFASVSLPEGCQTPAYTKIDMNGTATATVALYNSANDLDALAADADALAAQLKGIEGVGSVNVLGTPEKQLRITALDGLDLTALLIVQALSSENLNIPLGSIMQDGTTVSIRNASDATSVLDVMRLPVQLSLGSEMFLRLNNAKTLLQVMENSTYNQLGQLYTLYAVLPLFDPQNSKTDEELANTVSGSAFVPQNAKALITPQLVHLMRSGNFYSAADPSEPEGVDNISSECVLGKVLAVKRAHVNADGDPVYSGNRDVVVTVNEQGKRTAKFGEREILVDSFGYLVDENGNPVNEQGEILTLTDDEIAQRYNEYGSYTVLDDAEAVELCNALGLNDGLGIDVTQDIVRFVRTCSFGGKETPVLDENGADTGETQLVFPESIVVPLAYIGRVELRDNSLAYAEYNGLAAVTIEVYAVADANTTDVVEAVNKIIDKTSSSSKVLLLDDKAQFINDSIGNVLSSIIIGGVLAVLVIYLFVRKVGSSLVVSITMPLSVLVALCGLWVMNISLNLVSLGGLAVGIGMLVDNSIVVLESITKRRDRGESVYDACLNGTKEVAGSLFASTLTNVCVFFPILFVKGLTKEIFYDLVWAVLFSIVMSLIVAVTVIPSLYHLIYRKGPRKRYKKNPDGTRTEIASYEEREPRLRTPESTPEACAQTVAENGKAKRKARAPKNKLTISRMESGYGKVLSKLLTKRVLVCAVALAVFGLSIGLVFTTGTEFLPSVDKGVIEVDVDFDTSTTLADAQAAGKTVADAIREHYGDKLQYVSVTVGEQGLLATSNSAVIRIRTTKQLKTAQTVQEIRKLVASKDIAAKSVTVREMDGVVAEVTGGMSGQSVQLLGNDPEALRLAAAKVREELLKTDPAHIVSAVDNTPAMNTEYSLSFDRMLCAERGVDYQTAVMLLRVGLSGYTAANIELDSKQLAVTVQLEEAEAMDRVCNIVVGFGPDGAVKLKDVLKRAPDGALYTANVVASSIHKQNGKYATSVDLEIYDIDSGSAGKLIKKTVNNVLKDFDGVEYVEGGVSSYLNDAFDGLVVALVVAFVLLYSVMACQFESLVKPFIVIMSIPFSFTGGFLALAICGVTLNVVSFVGLIMLMGVIVNGAIVMIDKIDSLIAEGMTPQQAVVEGCKSRLRPILMTTLTTVLALVPLALGLGNGGELMQPMGIVVLGGLLLGTTVTLGLIPCFYCLVKRIRFDKAKVEQQDSRGDNEEKIS